MSDYYTRYCQSCSCDRKMQQSPNNELWEYCTYCEKEQVKETNKSTVRVRISIGTTSMDSTNTEEFLRVGRLLGVPADKGITFSSAMAYFDVSADFLLTCVDLQQILIERGGISEQVLEPAEGNRNQVRRTA